MSWGLTATGFIAKVLTGIKTEIEDSLRTSFGQSINLTAKSVFGQLTGIMSDRFAELWEVAQEVDASSDPDRATGAGLDKVCAITGTIRRPATKSTTTLTCTGTTGTPLAAARVVSVLTVGTKFQTTVGTTLLSVPAWTTTTAYAVGARVRNAGSVFQCSVAGTSAGGGGPSSHLGETDGTVTWIWLGLGDAAVDVTVECQQTGPFAAAAGTLKVIETPVSGWSNAKNLADATVGSDVETDAALRVRREAELEASGNAALEAIRANVLKVGEGTANAVTACYVFQNTTMVTNGDGLPPKSVEVLVQGGLDADIRAAIWKAVGAGIETYGGVSGTIVDSAGVTQTVKFSRPTTKNVYVTLVVTKDPLVFGVNGSNDIKAAVVAFGSTFAVGKDVTASAMSAQAFKVAGVLDVTATFIGTSPSPGSSATIVNTLRELALFDVARVVTTLSNGTP